MTLLFFSRFWATLKQVDTETSPVTRDRYRCEEQVCRPRFDLLCRQVFSLKTWVCCTREAQVSRAEEQKHLTTRPSASAILLMLATLAKSPMLNYNFMNNMWPIFPSFEAFGLPITANLEEKVLNKMYLTAVPQVVNEEPVMS